MSPGCSGSDFSKERGVDRRPLVPATCHSSAHTGLGPAPAATAMPTGHPALPGGCAESGSLPGCRRETGRRCPRPCGSISGATRTMCVIIATSAEYGCIRTYRCDLGRQATTAVSAPRKFCCQAGVFVLGSASGGGPVDMGRGPGAHQGGPRLLRPQRCQRHVPGARGGGTAMDPRRDRYHSGRPAWKPCTSASTRNHLALGRCRRGVERTAAELLRAARPPGEVNSGCRCCREAWPLVPRWPGGCHQGLPDPLCWTSPRSMRCEPLTDRHRAELRQVARQPVSPQLRLPGG